eukprot:XP_015150515.2 C-type lectin domain family 2 member D-like isoform X2 [Gallus gallus]
MDSQRGAKDANLSLRCIKDKLLPIAGTVLVAALLIAVIALAAQKRPPCPPCPTAAPHLPGCPNDGIGVGLQCFYFVEDAADWDGGQRFCLSRGAQLAAVGTPQELGFVLRYGRSVQYWIGLRRDRSGPWMWANGSLFNNAIEGSGRCAHTDGGGIGSAECSRPKRSVCSRPNGGGRSSEPTPGRRRGGLGRVPPQRGGTSQSSRLSVPTCPPPRPPPSWDFCLCPAKKRMGLKRTKSDVRL